MKAATQYGSSQERDTAGNKSSTLFLNMLLELEFHLIPKCAPSKDGCLMAIASFGSK